MKSLKQIREEFELNETEDKKLTTLVRAGLFDTQKLPLLKRALAKDNQKMSPTERGALLDLLDNLISQVLGDKNVYNKVRQNVMHVKEEILDEKYEIAGDMPVLLVLRRKAVRTYPDGQRVALYWSDKLKTYVSVPYSTINFQGSTSDGVSVGVSESVNDPEEVIKEEPKKIKLIRKKNVKENSILPLLVSIVEEKKNKNVIFEDGSSLMVDMLTASAITKVYNSINESNKSKMADALSKGKASFMKMAEFSLSKV